VKDGDVTTKGNLGSGVTASNYFDVAGSGGFPGIPAYGGTTGLNGSTVSATGWLVNSAYSSTKVYNSAYYLNAIPANIIPAIVPVNSEPGSYFTSGGTADSNGYYWYEYDGTATGLDFNISSAVSLGTRKVILIVKGANLNIGGNINLTKGSGFFLTVSTKNIVVASTVGGGGAANLEGIYVADGQFQTGTSATQLWIRGTVAAYGDGGLNLQRDLGSAGNPTTPAELFEYAPDQEILFPAKLSRYPSNWREVAP
jgi:hypothetical protein